jgi:hypothetical protein
VRTTGLPLRTTCPHAGQGRGRARTAIRSPPQAPARRRRSPYRCPRYGPWARRKRGRQAVPLRSASLATLGAGETQDRNVREVGNQRGRMREESSGTCRVEGSHLLPAWAGKKQTTDFDPDRNRDDRSRDSVLRCVCSRGPRLPFPADAQFGRSLRSHEVFAPHGRAAGRR